MRTSHVGALLALAALSLACTPGFLSGEGNPSLDIIDPNQAFTFAGRIVSTQSGAPISGATVTVGGVTTTSSGNGSFRVEVRGADASAATFAAPGFLTRSTFLAGGSDRPGRTIDLISTGAPFDLSYFDRLTRGFAQPEFPDFVLRWTTNPNFYIITNFTEIAPGNTRRSTETPVPQETLDRIAGISRGW